MDWARGRNAVSRLRATLLCIDVGPEDGVHSREVSFTTCFEPIDNIAVEAQMH